MNKTSLKKIVDSKTLGIFIIILLCGFVAFLILQRAWLCDDAYITFRTIDNFLHGFNLTWNTYERVQSYTSPLWMFILSFITFFTHNIYLTSIFTSVTFSILTICIFAFFISKNKYLTILGLLILAFSNAFIDFSTSGLEDALLFLLITIFSYFFLNIESKNTRNYYLVIFLTSLFAFLIALTRLDAILFVAPALIYLLYESKWKGLLYLFLGSIPLILWECFSLFYYGFPFPNTFYAKLNSGYPLIEYLQHGITYYLNILSKDPLTIIAIIFILLLSLKFSNTKNKILGLGLFLYLLYICRIGGDFMQGRFFAAPLILSIAILSQIKITFSNTWLKIIPVAIIILLGFMAYLPTFMVDSNKPISGSDKISDERRNYAPYTGLFRNNQFNTDIGTNYLIYSNPNNASVNALITGGLKAKSEPDNIESLTNIGIYGYLAGPKVKIIDPHGLSDPLLARLPALIRPTWRPGMFVKAIPKGYEDSVYWNQNKIADPNLAEYYANLKLITQGKLFSKDRFIAIIKMNLGSFNYLIDENEYKYYYNEKINAASLLCNTGARDHETGNEYGTEIDFSTLQHSKDFILTLTANDDYQINILKDNDQIESKKFLIDSDDFNKKVETTYYLNESTSENGFNRIIILPYGYSDYQLDYGCLLLQN